MPWGDLVGPNVAFAELADFSRAAPPWPEEMDFVGHASPGRKAEFAAGRHCARVALACLRAPDAAIPVGTSRAPIWPHGFVGSITHSDGYAAAAAARRSDYAGLGIDTERVGAVGPAIYDEVFAGDEFALLSRAPPNQRAATAAVLFSAKEALFKAQFGIFGLRLEFGDCELELRGCRIEVVRPEAFRLHNSEAAFSIYLDRVFAIFAFRA